MTNRPNYWSQSNLKANQSQRITSISYGNMANKNILSSKSNQKKELKLIETNTMKNPHASVLKQEKPNSKMCLLLNSKESTAPQKTVKRKNQSKDV